MNHHGLATLRVGSQPCGCDRPSHAPRLVVITGGPGAGKTAVLELAARSFCEHVAVLPEAATIVFGGGFPRIPTPPGRRAAQRAIFAVQRELERLVTEERQVAVALCDRGTVDGLAYWPDEPETFWNDVGSTREAELSRYAAVVHLHVPPPGEGYQTDDIRIEAPDVAAAIDEAISRAWAGHPNRTEIPADPMFSRKAAHALEAIRQQLPPCCRRHAFVTADE